MVFNNLVACGVIPHNTTRARYDPTHDEINIRMPQPQTPERHSPGPTRLGTHRLSRRSAAHRVDPRRDDKRLPVPKDGTRQG